MAWGGDGDRSGRRGRLGQGWLLGAALLYGAAALGLTFPLFLHLADHLVGHLNPAASADPLLTAWILSWDWQALTRWPGRLFQANIFFPAPDALAFSDSLLGTLPLSGPVYALSGNPVLAHNLALLGAFVLNGLAMAVCARRLFASKPAALVAGFAYAFAPLRFPHLFQLPLLCAWWTPLALLALEAWLAAARLRHLLLAVLLVWAQFLSSAYLGIMLGLLLAPYALLRLWPERRRLLRPRPLGQLALALLAGALLFGWAGLPYLRSQAQWDHQRGLADLLRYSAEPRSYLAADRTSLLYGDLTRPFRREEVPWESSLFPGMGLLLLALLGLRAGTAPSREAPGPARGPLLVWTGLGLVCSLGPLLILQDEPAAVPLPYFALYLGLPGLQGIRAPARFALAALLPLALFAGRGAERLLGRLRGRFAGAPRIAAAGGAALVLLALAAEALHTPVSLQRFTPLPEAAVRLYREAAAGGAALVLPLSPREPLPEAVRMLESTAHWAALANGYSGFRPGPYFELAELLRPARPSGPALEALEALGIRTLVVETDRLPETRRAAWDEAAPGEPRLALRGSWGGTRMYAIRPAGVPAGTLQASLALPDALPPGQRFRARLELAAPAGRPWRNPGPLGVASLEATWTPAAGPALTRSASVYLPSLLQAGEERALSLPLETPAVPGRYRLTLRAPGLSLSQPVEIAPAPAAGRPAARLAWLGAAPETLCPGQPLPLSLQVENAGDAAWRPGDGAGEAAPARLGGLGRLEFWWAPSDLAPRAAWRVASLGGRSLWAAAAHSDLGQYALRIRWRLGERTVASRLALLGQDLFPGQRLHLRGPLPTPAAPGDYRLEFALLSPAGRPLSPESGGLLRLGVRLTGPGSAP